MNLDPCTCLFQSHGFELYRHAGKALVIHRYSKRYKGDNGEPVVEKLHETLELDGDGWPSTQTAAEVRGEMRKAWADYVAWQEANSHA